MDTSQKSLSASIIIAVDTKPKERTKTKTEADYLLEAADRRERRGETVTALLFRNEAFRLSNDCGGINGRN